jgi:hypothetical protein
LNDFLARKRKRKTVLAGLRLKKQQYMGGEGLFVASRHNCTGTGYSSTAAVLFWLFREINGHKVATVLVFKSADN